MNRSMGLLERLAAQETSAAVRKRLDAVMEVVRRRERAARELYAASGADRRDGSGAGRRQDRGKGGRSPFGWLEEWRRDRVRSESAPGGGAAAGRFGTMLEQALRALEEEIAERKLTNQAKAVLQSAYSMSEEQAHLHLRTISRKSRRPLKEIARELIEARESIWLNPGDKIGLRNEPGLVERAAGAAGGGAGEGRSPPAYSRGDMGTMNPAISVSNSGGRGERRILRLIPGILLLAALGYAGKFTEQSIAAYGKAHHMALPNIEYVLWAIIFGLVVVQHDRRSGGVSAGRGYLRILAQDRDRVSGSAVPVGRRLQAGRIEPGLRGRLSWRCRSC